MLTQNAKTLEKIACIIGNTSRSLSSLTTAGLQIKDKSGNSSSLSYVYCGNSLFNSMTLESSYGNVNMEVGTGNTPPALGDYNLTENKTGAGNMVCKSVTSALFRQNGINRINYTAIFSNASNANITICEVGLFKTVNTSPDVQVLLAREVLDTPITVAPNGVCTVTMTVEV